MENSHINIRSLTLFGSLDAEFEYGPFGNVIKIDGVAGSVCPFLFSTKYTDDETGLLYYGFRYYNPSIGRWLNRDPLEEGDGPSLYAFVGNNPLDRVDLLGLEAQTRTGRCSAIDYIRPLKVDLGKGWKANIRLSKCDYCCGSDRGSIKDNYGKKKTLYTGDITVSFEGEISLRDKLLSKSAYGVPFLLIIKAIEGRSNQVFGNFGVRGHGEGTLKITWDPCRESFTGGKSVSFNINGEAFGKNNLGSAGSGWLAYASATGGGSVKGRIYVEGRVVYVEGEGKLSGSASYNLIWQDFGGTQGGHSSGSIDGSLDVLAMGKQKVWVVPTMDW